VDGEAAVFVDVVAVGSSGAAVGVAGVTDGVDEGAARPKYPADLADQRVDLLGGQGHAQQHVREDRVHGGVRQRQPVTDIVYCGGDPLVDVLGAGGLLQLPKAGGGEIGGLDGEPLAGEVQGVAAVPRAKLQHVPRPGRMEHRGGVDCWCGRLLAVHTGVGGVGVLPVPALGVGQFRAQARPPPPRPRHPRLATPLQRPPLRTPGRHAAGGIYCDTRGIRRQTVVNMHELLDL
jgi:hypothetical protein